MAISKIVALNKGNPTNSDGAKVATSINKIIDKIGTDDLIIKAEAIQLKGITQTVGAPSGFGDLKTVVNDLTLGAEGLAERVSDLETFQGGIEDGTGEIDGVSASSIASLRANLSATGGASNVNFGTVGGTPNASGTQVAEKVNNLLDLQVPNLKALASITPQEGATFYFGEYCTGSGFGGGPVKWDAAATHNGVTAFAPAAISAWNGTQAALNVIHNWTGPLGAWVRVLPPDYIPHVDHAGGIGDANLTEKTGTNNNQAFLQLVTVFSRYDFSGGKNYLISESIAPSKSFFMYGLNSTIYQSDLTKPVIDMAACSDSELQFGDFTHRALIDDYDPDNNKPAIYNQSGAVNNVTFWQVRVYESARQGIRNDGGGSRWKIGFCKIERTLRDGVFLLNCNDSSVVNSWFTNTGDDSIAFAGNCRGILADGNQIIGAGSNNLGGSGIRANGAGSISNNTIIDSDLFGVICAVNDNIPDARPDGLFVTENTIIGINKTGVVTAGIGFKSVIHVECDKNYIEMPDNEAHAHRIYDTGVKSEFISISGGKIVNALSAMYIRNLGVTQLKINGVYNQLSDDFVLFDGTGSIDYIDFGGNVSDEISGAGYFRSTTANTLTVGSINSYENRLQNPLTVPFAFNTLNVQHVLSTNDQYPSGLFADYSGGGSVGSYIIDDRFGEKLRASGTITFNATNTGLISLGDLDKAPLASEIKPTLITSLGSATYSYVDFQDSQNFRIRLNAAPAANVTFDWKVRAYDNRKVI